MQLKQLQFFVVSVDMGSFKAAAETLYTSQPHISKTVKALEEDLGMQLLDRRANGVVVTEQGSKVYEYALDILRGVEMIHKLKEEQVVSQFSVFANYGCQVSDLYVEFYRKYAKKDARFRFREGTVEEGIRYLHRHMAEIGIVCVPSQQSFAFRDMLQHKRQKFHLLKQAPFCLFVGPMHPLYSASSVSIPQLRDLNLIQQREDFFSFTNCVGHIKNDLRIFKDIPKIVTVDSIQEILQFLRDTRLAYVGSGVIPNQFEQYQVRGIPIESDTESIYFGYFTGINTKLSPLGKEFVDFLQGRLT